MTALRSERAEGRLAAALVESMRAEPLLLSQLAHAVLDANFAEHCERQAAVRQRFRQT